MTLSSTLSKIAVAMAFAIAPLAASAASITPISATPQNLPGITQGNLADALDGNLGTGYLVTNTNAQAQGFFVQYDFDISGYSSVDSFTFNFTGVYSSDNSAFQSLRFGANPYFNFTTVNTPIDQQFSTSLATTALGSGFADTDNYIVGSTLSVFVQTSLGGGPGSYVSINALEITADINGVAVSAVPLPASLPLLISAIGVVGVARRKRKAA